jgi:hypothetical protein
MLLKKDTIKKQCEGGRRRLKRKLALSKAIAKRVAAMNAVEDSILINETEVNCEETSWMKMAKKTSIFDRK